MNIDVDPRDFDRPPADYVAENRWARERDPFMIREDGSPKRQIASALVGAIAAGAIAIGIVLIFAAWHLSKVPAEETTTIIHKTGSK